MRWLSAKGVLPVGLFAVKGFSTRSEDRSKTEEDLEFRGGDVAVSGVTA